ncbi:MAG: hypothetical protein KDC70_13440 [Saprospiraceae bacterium]|nr:hypothetical protein [Saprospiraceae bacterium]
MLLKSAVSEDAFLRESMLGNNQTDQMQGKGMDAHFMSVLDTEAYCK